MQTGIEMGFNCVDFLDCVIIHYEVIRNISMSSNFLNTLYVLVFVLVAPYVCFHILVKFR